ncbi:MAG: SRPBCC family protein [Ornithinimicrobium sp.]|uniref:SRPBCC family protein n=1 Tax=Ornithinimicrobium sp. TaxID=1977084 RepID=UPI0026DED5F7|nr:SRPBCC family protein [Ornithinimicrobium sp.]MDO5739674.1 SRPBCC family protein [Ornithinimicrobium sp.]
MPSTYIVERSTTISSSPHSVYEQIADFRQWPGWSPWEGLDPQMHRVYTGADSGVGASYAWSGNKKAGSGSMVIVEAEEPSKVRIDLVFEKPFPASNDTWFTIMPDGAGSRVTWTLTGVLTRGLKLMGVFRSMDTMIGPDFDKGLAQLKELLEIRVS